MHRMSWVSSVNLANLLLVMQSRQPAAHSSWGASTLAHETPLTMLSIQPGAGCCTQEELAAICVLASIGHAENACPCVLELEIFVLEVSAIDGLPTSAITCISSDTLVGKRLSAQLESTAAGLVCRI